MPIYIYEDRKGKRVQRFARVPDRDAAAPRGFRRVIDGGLRVGVCLGAKPLSAEAEARKGLNQIEEQGGSYAFESQMGWTGNQLRKIWAEEN